MNLRLYLSELERGFDFVKAVCNHGYFMMAPNVWNPIAKSLSRPLTLHNSSSVMVTISHPVTLFFLVIQVHGINNVRTDDESLILQQVRRMLRFTTNDERDVAEFHQLHEAAKESDFGRIFRSASLFEDMVKTILLCNSDWKKTLRMASDLYELQVKLTRSKKRARDGKTKKEICGNFPSAKEIASVDHKFINEHCKLGYRAKQIVILAKKFESKPLIFEEMEKREMEPKQVIKELRKLKGFGVFATANVLMCLGYYHLVPSDTETLRLLREVHGREECSKRTLEREAQLFYNRFAPFQSLAYWFDLIQNYETRHGKLSELSPDDHKKVAG